MKAVIQRVLKSSVSVDGKVVGSSGKGYMILVGVAKGDTEKHADLLASKTASLRAKQATDPLLHQARSLYAPMNFTNCIARSFWNTVSSVSKKVFSVRI